ncbi:uncharacterized protein LOC132169155 [Corylus avellana]|uniref:uncharacterized protein LOC132169155 n=1 Tax=Corylus avellana TaxID=13451 RepID=UPI00286D2F81|nr:uncharacterized protein LOC132169155 [Corylus avellana]
MEQDQSDNNANGNKGEATKHAVEKKKRRPTHILKAASFALRRSKKSKPIHVEAVESKGMWRRLVGSMLPLHGNQLPSLQTSECSDDTAQSTVSQSGASSSSCSEASVSRYASAANLAELDRSEDDDDDDHEAYRDCSGGDEMIDVKADVFIARFYEQMKLQRMDSVDRRYHEMNKRSIG